MIGVHRFDENRCRTRAGTICERQPGPPVCAVVAQPLPLAFLALLGGKGLRYGAYAWLAAKSPQKARAIAARYGI